MVDGADPLSGVSQQAGASSTAMPLSKAVDATQPGEAGGTNLQQRIEQKREDARRGIAYTIVGCFAAVIVTSFLLFWTRGSASVDDVVKVIQAVLSPVVGIVGAVTGFYFSASQSNAASDKTPPP